MPADQEELPPKSAAAFLPEDEELAQVLQKQDLREKNTAAFTSRPDPSSFKNLDGSIKKNTSFIKKIRVGLTLEQVPALAKDIASLKLEKYLSEIVVALAEAKFRSSSDIWAVVQISSLLHQRFADFAPQFIPALVKALGPPPPPPNANSGTPLEQRDKEESVRVSRQRSVLRLLTDLYFVGIARDPPNQKEGFMGGLLKELLGTDREHHLNLPIAVGFVRYFRQEFALSKRHVATKPSESTSDEVSDRNDDPSESAEKIRMIKESFVPVQFQEIIRGMLIEYYKSVEKHLVRDHKRIRKMEKQNHEHFIARGEISEERQERYEKNLRAYEKLLANTQTLAENLDQEMPELPEDESVTRIGFGASEINQDKDDKDATGGDKWEDSDAKAFYENLVDLRNHVPAIFLGEKKEKNEEAALAEQKALDELEPVLENDNNAVEEDNDVDDSEQMEDEEPFEGEPENEESLLDDLGLPDEESKEEDADAQDATKNIGSSAQAKLEALLIRLPNALNRETIDQIAVDFAFLNSKAARGKLVRTLLGVSRQRLDLLPYYARLIATLVPYMPDVGTNIVDALERSFHGHQKRKEQVFIEEKTKNIRFIGELTKFKVTPLHVVFHCIKLLLDNFKHHNIDLLCTLLETCGRFLYNSPETHTRTVNYLDILMRKKNVKNVDNRQALMIENAYYQCNPPATPAIIVKKRSDLELYFRKLIYLDMSKKTVEKILKQLRKFNWEDATTRRMFFNAFTKIWKVKFSNIVLMAFLASELARYYPDFGVSVVDHVLEEVRIGLEQNLYKHNQRRVATLKYLGELYNYRMVDGLVIFDTLYLIVRFGHENNLPRPGVGIPLDAQHDFFRVRLCCTLLDSCGQCFDRGTSAKRLDQFLAFLQMYIHTKPRPPMDIEFTISETLELLRPKLKLVESYEEAIQEVARIATEQMAQMQNGQAETHGTEESDEDEYDDRERRNGELDDEEEDPDESEDDNESDEDEANQEEDDAVVVRMQEIIDEEADDDFEREFSRMMQESLESRRSDRKSTFDAPVPVKLAKPLEKAFPVDNSSDGVAFTLLTKRGNKQQAKTMALPADSSFVISTRHKLEAEQEEKMHLKQLVLNYEERERELARRAAEADSSVWGQGRGKTVLMSSSGDRGTRGQQAGNLRGGPGMIGGNGNGRSRGRGGASRSDRNDPPTGREGLFPAGPQKYRAG
ncbi:hypothetical protein HDU85_004126 [Gaertneriomyces sp. JEL0708]|nr:hypothetical protein HDU85_004126 [Gaertneriomyces sp. JEL0708]